METAAFALDEIIEQQQVTGNSWFEFLNNSNLSMGVLLGHVLPLSASLKDDVGLNLMESKVVQQRIR